MKRQCQSDEWPGRARAGLPNKVDGPLAGGDDGLIDGQQRRLPSVGFVLHQDDEEELVENSLQGLQSSDTVIYFHFITNF